MTRNMSVIQGSGDDHGHGGRFAFGPSKTPNLSASYRGSLLSNSFLPSTSSSRSTTTTLNASTISEDVVDIEYFSGYSTITTMGMHSTYGSSSSATYDYDEEVGEVAEDRSNEIYLTRLLYSIDLFVFDDFTRPPDRDDQVIEIPNNLLTECHVWRDKFRRKRGARPKWSTESMVLANNNSNSSRQRAPSSYSLLASTLHPTILPQLPSSPHDQPTSLQLNLVFPQLPSVSNESRSLQHGNSFSKYAPTKPPDLPISAWTRPQREPSSGRRVTLPPLVNRFAQSANKSNAAESRPPMAQIRDLGNEDSWFIRALAVPADTSRPQCPTSFNWPNVQSEESRSVLPSSSKATSIGNNTRRRRLRWSRDDSLTSMSSFTSASSSVIRNRYHSLVGDRVDLSFEEDEFEENPKTALHLPSIES